jgi:hypothetical protein
MARTHAEFAKQLKVEKSTQTKPSNNEYMQSINGNTQERSKIIVMKNRNNIAPEFIEYKKQRMNNKYNNWVKQRRENGEDCSIELFEKLKSYFNREEKKLEELFQIDYKKAEKKYNSGRGYTDDDEIMYQIKRKLYEWRESDTQYQELKKEIEEFRMISDKSIESLSYGGR